MNFFECCWMRVLIWKVNFVVEGPKRPHAMGEGVAGPEIVADLVPRHESTAARRPQHPPMQSFSPAAVRLPYELRSAHELM